MESCAENRTICGRWLMWFAVGFPHLQLLLASRLWSRDLSNLGNIWEIWLPLPVELLYLVIGSSVVAYYFAKASNKDHSYCIHGHIDDFGRCCRWDSLAYASIQLAIFYTRLQKYCVEVRLYHACVFNTYTSIFGHVCQCGWQINKSVIYMLMDKYYFKIIKRIITQQS